MASTTWILELDRTHWRLYSCCADAAPTIVEQDFAATELQAQAPRINDELVAQSYHGEPILVALASSLCLSVTLPVRQSKELRDRQTMLYRLEECIPWPAEELVADFARVADKALVVAALIEPLAQLFTALEATGIQIPSIVPKALLATIEHVSRGATPEQQLVAFEQDEWVDLVLIEAGNAVSWRWLPLCGTAVSHEVKSFVAEYGCKLPFVVYGYTITSSNVTELSDFIELQSKTDETYDSLVFATAEHVIRGEIEAPIELKRDAFGRVRADAALRRYTTAFCVAVSVMVIAIAGALLWRGQLASREAERVMLREADTFRRIFPNTKVPIGIRGRLESELVKLNGLQGGDESLPNAVSAIRVLYSLLTALPTDRRFRLLEIRIEEGRLHLDAEVRDHGDAEVIAQRLRGNGFQVASPRTQRVDDKRVALRISGTMTKSLKVAARKPS